MPEVFVSAKGDAADDDAPTPNVQNSHDRSLASAGSLRGAHELLLTSLSATNGTLHAEGRRGWVFAHVSPADLRMASKLVNQRDSLTVIQAAIEGSRLADVLPRRRSRTDGRNTPQVGRDGHLRQGRST